MNNPALALLGFAAKARKLSFGTHATMFALESKKARLVCAAEDISPKSVKELKFKASNTNVPVIILKYTNMETLSKTVGKNCGILAVNDDGFAQALLKKQAEIDEGGTSL